MGRKAKRARVLARRARLLKPEMVSEPETVAVVEIEQPAKTEPEVKKEVVQEDLSEKIVKESAKKPVAKKKVPVKKKAPIKKKTPVKEEKIEKTDTKKTTTRKTPVKKTTRSKTTNKKKY